MIDGFTRYRSLIPPFAAIAAITLFSSLPCQALAAKDNTGEGFRGAAYQAEAAYSVDFRNITTLGEFDRTVYRNRWNGIDADDLLVELKKFNGVAGSPALREIWRDALLSDFDGLDISNGGEQADLMAERLNILNKLGYFDEAVRLYVEAAQKKPIPEAVARMGVQAMALAGSADGACLEVLMASQYLKGDEWVQNAALCSAYFGQNAKATEYYDAVSKTGGSGFRTAYKMLANHATQTIQLDIPPLWRTLLIARGATIGSLGKADAMTLASVAANKKVALGTRLAAANRAADAGIIGFDRLRKLYELKHATDAGVADIIAKMKAGEALSQSDLYSAARFTFEGNARAEIVQKAVESMHPRTSVKGHVYGWIVDKLTLQPERIKWFAPRGFALMVETNRRASADIYYKTGKLDTSPLSIIHAVLEQQPWAAADQKSWAAAMVDAGKSKARTDKAYNIARAFDQENKLALRDTPAIQTDALKPVSLLQNSVRQGGKGLTLISALNTLAKPKDLTKLSTEETSDIIATMGKQGLFGERKKIALEILLQTVL